tara:strand:+ start:8613 stop:8861 length:249 start_codon:yes stop_codon:yes gene_type:complete
MPDAIEKLLDSMADDQRETLRCLQGILTTLSTIHQMETDAHNQINTTLRQHMGALVGIIILLILGVFALVNIKLQYPAIPGP